MKIQIKYQIKKEKEETLINYIKNLSNIINKTPVKNLDHKSSGDNVDIYDEDDNEENYEEDFDYKDNFSNDDYDEVFYGEINNGYIEILYSPSNSELLLTINSTYWHIRMAGVWGFYPLYVVSKAIQAIHNPEIRVEDPLTVKKIVIQTHLHKDVAFFIPYLLYKMGLILLEEAYDSHLIVSPITMLNPTVEIITLPIPDKTKVFVTYIAIPRHNKHIYMEKIKPFLADPEPNPTDCFGMKSVDHDWYAVYPLPHYQ